MNIWALQQPSTVILKYRNIQLLHHRWCCLPIAWVNPSSVTTHCLSSSLRFSQTLFRHSNKSRIQITPTCCATKALLCRPLERVYNMFGNHSYHLQSSIILPFSLSVSRTMFIQNGMCYALHIVRRTYWYAHTAPCQTPQPVQVMHVCLARKYESSMTSNAITTLSSRVLK